LRTLPFRQRRADARVNLSGRADARDTFRQRQVKARRSARRDPQARRTHVGDSVECFSSEKLHIALRSLLKRRHRPTPLIAAAHQHICAEAP